MTDSSRCPGPEQIAAFVAGSLSGEELTMVTEHIRTCDDCRQIVAAAAAIDRDPEFAGAAPLSHRRVSPLWWLAAAAAALIGIVYVSTRSVRPGERNDAIHQLVEAMPRDGRYLEPRLSGGFPWAPVLPVRRDAAQPLDPREMKLIGAAGDVLEKTAKDPSPQAQHATALAHLLAGRPAEAAAILAKLATSSNDPAIWSDLAAARYAAAVQLNQPKQLAQALVAADTAIRLDPKLPEALFNRALTVERLGLRDRARRAWEQYLAVDDKSPWAEEARKHLQRVAQSSTFQQELDHEYVRLETDAAYAASFARRYPQEARMWGETQILGRWAEAFQNGRAQEAAGHLAVARAFGQSLAANGGDGMLHDLVAAIDAATPEQRRDLAEAHIRFREAQQRFRSSRPAEAETLFEQAAKGFADGRSPGALLARYFAANTLFSRNDLVQSRQRIEQLLASAPPYYLAHRAQVQWQTGMQEGTDAQWGAAIEALSESVRLFDRLGEKQNSAFVRQILAEVYDRIGDPKSAWANRLTALQELGSSEDRRLQGAVYTVAHAASLEGDWPGSLAFLDLALEMSPRDGTDTLRFEALLFRARVHERLGQNEPAAADLDRAGVVWRKMSDRDTRERAEADWLAVTGMIAPSPLAAVPSLTRAIEFNDQKGRRMYLPELYLERGRAHRTLRDDAAAADDFEAGIRELEEQRLSLHAREERWGMFSSFGELFDEAVDLALVRKDLPRAFAYAERARARELLDSMGATPAAAATPTPRPPANNAVLIEYATLPASLVAFVVGQGDLRVVQTQVPRAVLTREADNLADSAMSGDVGQFRTAASTLYSRLLQPIADSLPEGRRLVIVPDAALSTVPFSALIDPAGKYLIERYPIVVAPSAAVFAGLMSRLQPMPHDPHLLLIAGPAGKEGDVRQLNNAQREADAVTAIYHHDPDVVSDERSAAMFEQRAAKADVIHFVGHADGALVTARGGRLDVRSIAKLRLGRTRTVILAACGTARGHHGAGEESISIARAFLAAGAQSVVATLWAIDDDPAAEFFPRLHRYLADGLSPADAVRATQLEWIRRRDAPPGLWAAVQIIGS